MHSHKKAISINELNHINLESIAFLKNNNINASSLIYQILETTVNIDLLDINPSNLINVCLEVDGYISHQTLFKLIKSVNNFRCNMDFNIEKSLTKIHPLFNDEAFISEFAHQMRYVKSKLLRKTLVQCFNIWNNKKLFFVYNHPQLVIQWLSLKDYPLSRIPSHIIFNSDVFMPILKGYYPFLQNHEILYELNFLQKTLLSND